MWAVGENPATGAIKKEDKTMWAALWRSENKLNGKTEYFIRSCSIPRLFRTREEARNFIKENYRYIKFREDLRGEPHGWKVPIAIKVDIVAKK